MKIRIKGFIQKSPSCSAPKFFAADMSRYDGYVTLATVDTEIDIEIPPDWNPIAAEIASLNAQLDAINDRHMHDVRAIKTKLNDLMCIDMTVTA